MKSLRAAVYCHISTVEDTQQHSLQFQKEYYESYINMYQINLIKLIDRAIIKVIVKP